MTTNLKKRRRTAARAAAAVSIDQSETSRALARSLSDATPETAVTITDALANMGTPAVDSLFKY